MEAARCVRVCFVRVYHVCLCVCSRCVESVSSPGTTTSDICKQEKSAYQSKKEKQGFFVSLNK